MVASGVRCDVADWISCGAERVAGDSVERQKCREPHHGDGRIRFELVRHVPNHSAPKHAVEATSETWRSRNPQESVKAPRLLSKMANQPIVISAPSDQRPRTTDREAGCFRLPRFPRGHEPERCLWRW
jgi:hypothetical protein